MALQWTVFIQNNIKSKYNFNFKLGHADIGIIKGKQRGSQKRANSEVNGGGLNYINQELAILLYCLEYEHKHTEEMVKKSCKAENKEGQSREVCFVRNDFNTIFVY